MTARPDSRAQALDRVIGANLRRLRLQAGLPLARKQVFRRLRLPHSRRNQLVATVRQTPRSSHSEDEGWDRPSVAGVVGLGAAPGMAQGFVGASVVAITFYITAMLEYDLDASLLARTRTAPTR